MLSFLICKTMNYEKKHHAYKVTLGGLAIPVNEPINGLDRPGRKMATHYIGTYSEFNPIGYRSGLSVVVRKPYTNESFPQKDFKLKGFTLRGGLNSCGGDFNTNHSISFTKQELLRIAHAMDKGNELIISMPTSLNHNKFQKSIKQVTG